MEAGILSGGADGAVRLQPRRTSAKIHWIGRRPLLRRGSWVEEPDTAVPFEENGALFQQRFRKAGGVLETNAKPVAGVTFTVWRILSPLLHFSAGLPDRDSIRL